MTLARCASCTLKLRGDEELCSHNHVVYGDDWAAVNRIMCDFFHRNSAPKRVRHAGLQLKVVLALGAAGLSHVSVDTEDDKVFLEGEVRLPEERERAEDIAASVHGVREVTNHLTH